MELSTRILQGLIKYISKHRIERYNLFIFHRSFTVINTGRRTYKNKNIILNVGVISRNFSDCRRDLDFLIVFIKLLHLATSHCSTEIAIGHTRPSQSDIVFTSRCLVAASSTGRSCSSRFPNYPRPQLPVSHFNN
jgi:hypothetical protein